MTRFNALRPVVVMLVALGNLTLPAHTSAVERAHHSRGTASFVLPPNFVDPSDFVGAGNATHLGTYDEVGYVEFSDTEDPFIRQIDGWVTYTSVKGHELDATFTGQLNLRTGVITATLTYDGGSGRFENASGSATLSGQALSDGTIAVTVKGTIDF